MGSRVISLSRESVRRSTSPVRTSATQYVAMPVAPPASQSSSVRSSVPKPIMTAAIAAAATAVRMNVMAIGRTSRPISCLQIQKWAGT